MLLLTGVLPRQGQNTFRKKDLSIKYVNHYNTFSELQINLLMRFILYFFSFFIVHPYENLHAYIYIF